MTSSSEAVKMRMDVIVCLMTWRHLTDLLEAAQSSFTFSPYELFDAATLSEAERLTWQAGTPCSSYVPRTNSSLPLGAFFCPMPFEVSTFTECCGEVHDQYCCEAQQNSGAMQWTIGIIIAICSIIVGLIVVCSFNKCTALCVKRGDETQRPKIKINPKTRDVRPMDKRTILKSANYTVEKNWDQLHIKFHNREYYEKFSEAVYSRYQDVTWRKLHHEAEASFKASSSDPVTLRMLPNPKIIIVTQEGNFAWVMNDFQNICKNLVISEWADKKARNQTTVMIPLTPRLPTIGEESYDAGDFNAKISQSEIEIKFKSERLFENFRKLLLFKYPNCKWHPYLQRDCTQLSLEGGQALSLHIWEQGCSLWLAGEGKRPWYAKEFQELYGDAVTGRMPDTTTISPFHEDTDLVGPPPRELQAATLARFSTKDYPDVFTVKPLESGYEMDFPSDFLPKLKTCIQKVYPSLKWQEYSSRQVTKIFLSQGKSVTIHISSPLAEAKKLWLFDEPGCNEWLHGEFRYIYGAVYEAMYRFEDIPDNEVPVTPVDSSV